MNYIQYYQHLIIKTNTNIKESSVNSLDTSMAEIEKIKIKQTQQIEREIVLNNMSTWALPINSKCQAYFAEHYG